MKLTAYILLILIILTSDLKWFFYPSFRIDFHDILIFLFTCLFFLSNYKFILRKLKGGLSVYILFLWGWFFFAAFSGIFILLYPQGVVAYSFFLKGLLLLFVYTYFFTILICYLSSLSANKREMLVYWFIAGVVLSSIYGFVQLVLIMRYNIDIDENISRFIGLQLADGEYINFYQQAYGYLSRINGITGDPSTHATYSLTALPLLLLGFFKNRHNSFIIYLILFLIVFFSLVLTMSGSGIVGFAFSILALLLLRFRIPTPIHIVYFLILFVILFSFYLYFNEDILYYAQIRFNPQGTISTHSDIAINSLNIGLKYPLGVGFNNFAIAYENQYGISSYNPHNTWIGYFVQTGFLGLLYQVILSLYIVYKCLKRRTFLSDVFIASYIGICVAALGYQILDRFNIQLFVALFFTVVMLEKTELRDSVERSSPVAKISNGI